jgi:hypothetical protein
VESGLEGCVADQAGTSNIATITTIPAAQPVRMRRLNPTSLPFLISP